MPDTPQRWHSFAWMGEVRTYPTAPVTSAICYHCLCGCGREVCLPCSLALLKVLHAWARSAAARWEE